MTESTFPISPGVVANETDLSGPTKVSPSGIPAGVIGTAVRGPAFVPITVATFQDFISTFGNSDGLKFGPMTMREVPLVVHLAITWAGLPVLVLWLVNDCHKQTVMLVTMPMPVQFPQGRRVHWVEPTCWQPLCRSLRDPGI